MIGRTLAHYKVLQRIGAGGMGEVYLAEDTTLNRRVALKVLPAEFAASDERRERFAREAKALAALNHPNIVTVHAVAEHDGVHFIAMELVKGKTLADVLPAQGFSLARFFDIAVPLADAVAAAHEQHIVHRDLKPGNVMVTDDGRVKVLDFGLAKAAAGLAGSDAATGLPTATKTTAGVIVGTWNYMSPEQALGQVVDARSDIFSLGIVFYEMLTGRRPFAGSTPTETLASIIKDTPRAVSELSPGLPRELTRLVRVCLSKDPSRRVLSAVHIRNELAELKRELDSGELLADVRTTPPTRPVLRTTLRWAAAVVGLLMLAGGVWRWRNPEDTHVLQLRDPLQVTSAVGVESRPTWSPDGGRIAYVSDQSGNEDIWVTQSTGGSAANFTADHRGGDRDPAWSPDGSQIAFVSERDGGGIYVMPAIGGPANRISLQASAEGIVSPQWSSDGTDLAYIRREDQGTFIEVVSLRSRESRRLLIPGGPGNRFDLSWSADGRFFAYARAPNRNDGISQLWVLPATGGEAIPITDGKSGDWSPMWATNARTLFFLSNRRGSFDLWQQSIAANGRPEGEPAAITVGIGIQHAAFTFDRRKLGYSKGGPVANVWRVPILNDREATWADAEQLTFDQAYISGLDLSPDGQHLLVSSDRGGNPDIWAMPIGGSAMRQVTTDPAPDLVPRVSPNGRQVAFYSYRSGNRDIWVTPLEGGAAVQLTHDPEADMLGSWSPDGRNVLFYSNRTGNIDAFIVPATGGEARRLTTEASPDYFPQLSPDERWMVFASFRDGINRLWRMPASGGAAELMTQAPAFFFRWSPDGKQIYFPGDQRGNNDLWSVTIDGHERRMTRFSQRAGSLDPNSLAADSAYLYFAWRNDLGDIWVMDVVSQNDE